MSEYSSAIGTSKDEKISQDLKNKKVYIYWVILRNPCSLIAGLTPWLNPFVWANVCNPPPLNMHKLRKCQFSKPRGNVFSHKWLALKILKSSLPKDQMGILENKLNNKLVNKTHEIFCFSNNGTFLR
jgi:hypothetical protein